MNQTAMSSAVSALANTAGRRGVEQPAGEGRG